MGNVYATAAPPPIVPLIETQDNEDKKKPGSMEDLHKKCKGIILFLKNFYFYIDLYCFF